MDVAASEFYREGKYDLDFKSPPDPERHISGEELADIYQGFVSNYPGTGSSSSSVVRQSAFFDLYPPFPPSGVN